MNIVNRCILGFSLFISTTNQAAIEDMLFAAIKRGDYIGVKKAINAGASINAVDSSTGDTPVFYAIHLLTDLRLHDYISHENIVKDIIYSLYHNRELRIATLCVLPIFVGAYIAQVIKKYQFLKIATLDDEIFYGYSGIALCGILELLFIKIRQIQMNNRANSYGQIIKEILEHPDLNLNYHHAKTGQTIKSLIEDILEAKIIGYYCMCLNGIPISHPYDSVVILKVNDKWYFYRYSLHIKHIEPLMRQFISLINSRN